MTHCTCTGNGVTQESGLAAWLTACHRTCDSLWAEVEEAALKDRPEDLRSAVSAFISATRNHLEIEEEKVFPRLAMEVPMAAHGPLPVMLGEHEQMRGFMDAIAEAARTDSTQRVLDLGDTLLMLTQQHNSKEEGVLYPLCEQALADSWPELNAAIVG